MVFLISDFFITNFHSQINVTDVLLYSNSNNANMYCDFLNSVVIVKFRGIKKKIVSTSIKP